MYKIRLKPTNGRELGSSNWIYERDVADGISVYTHSTEYRATLFISIEEIENDEGLKRFKNHFDYEFEIVEV